MGGFTACEESLSWNFPYTLPFQGLKQGYAVLGKEEFYVPEETSLGYNSR